MKNNVLKTIITAGILLVLFIIAVKILKFAIGVLLPLAIIIVAAYIIYSLVSKKRY